MALTLHYHPLSSFCMKALVGLYELDVPFHGNIVDLGNAEPSVSLNPCGDRADPGHCADDAE